MSQKEIQVVSRVENERSSLFMSLMFRGRKGVGSDRAARDVLVAILNNRLLRLRSRQALTYGMYARYIPERGPGLWRITGDVDAARSTEATKAILDILRDLKENPKGYLREFADARTILMSRIGLESPTAAEAAYRLTELARYELEDDYFENYARSLSRLRPSDITKLIESEFSLNRAVIGLRGPEESIDATNAVLREFRAKKTSLEPPKPEKNPSTSTATQSGPY